MNKEEIKIKEFDKQQLELLLNDLKDIDKFTGFKDGAFKYELGKYQASLLVNCIKKQKEVIDKLKKCINDFPAIHYSSIEKVNKKRLSGKLIPVDELLEILKESDVDE